MSRSRRSQVPALSQIPEIADAARIFAIIALCIPRADPILIPTHGHFVFSLDHCAGSAVGHCRICRGLQSLGEVSQSDARGVEWDRGAVKTAA